MKTFTPNKAAGFTLVEMLVSTTIIALIMVVMLGMTNQTSQTWRYTTEKVEKFQIARDGFEGMTRRISQATLNTYWDYVDKNGKIRTQFLEGFPHDNGALSRFVPDTYGRMSELRFTSGPMSAGTNKLLDGSVPEPLRFPTHGVFFQAPLGEVTDDTSTRKAYGADYTAMTNALNTWGYFVETSDYDERPTFITENIMKKRWRSRLMELRLPAEKMGVYDAYSTDRSNNWFQSWIKIPNNASPPRPVRVLAENVTALIIWPKLSKPDEDARVLVGSAALAQAVLSPLYNYNSNPPIDSATQKPATRNPGVNWNATAVDDIAEKGGVNPINQLPPVVQVTMVAIDERSARRLVEINGIKTGSKKDSDYTLGFDISTLFVTACTSNRWPLSDPTQYEVDLAAYEKMLIEKNITYRVFSTNVSIRGSKWSRSQL